MPLEPGRRVRTRSPHTKAANPLTFNGSAGSNDPLPKAFQKSKGKTSPLSPVPQKSAENKKGSSTDFPNLRQFFRNPPPPVEDATTGKPKKAKMAVNTGLIHDTVKEYLAVYEDAIARPWALHKKSFTCGYTKEFLMWKSLKETAWMVPKKVWRDRAIADIVAEHGGRGKKNN